MTTQPPDTPVMPPLKMLTVATNDGATRYLHLDAIVAIEASKDGTVWVSAVDGKSFHLLMDAKRLFELMADHSGRPIEVWSMNGDSPYEVHPPGIGR